MPIPPCSDIPDPTSSIRALPAAPVLALSLPKTKTSHTRRAGPVGACPSIAPQRLSRQSAPRAPGLYVSVHNCPRHARPSMPTAPDPASRAPTRHHHSRPAAPYRVPRLGSVTRPTTPSQFRLNQSHPASSRLSAPSRPQPSIARQPTSNRAPQCHAPGGPAIPCPPCRSWPRLT